MVRTREVNCMLNFSAVLCGLVWLDVYAVQDTAFLWYSSNIYLNWFLRKTKIVLFCG